MTSILTITLNPAVDYSTSVERVVAGEKLYCREARIDPGGGGVNVARVIARLDGNATAFVVTGGAMGECLLSLLADEKVHVENFPVAGETRYSLAVEDEGTGGQYRFSLPGVPLSPAEEKTLLERINEAAPTDGFVVLSGGLANGLPEEFPQLLQSALSRCNRRLIVDTSKAPLLRLINSPVAPVDVLRLDRSETEKAHGRPLQTIGENLAFGRELVRRGVARTVVAGHGSDGSVMFADGIGYFCRAPKVDVRSKIGAGDALVGAFTASLARGEPPEQALKWGVAAAAATVGSEGTALCDKTSVEALLPACRLERIAL